MESYLVGCDIGSQGLKAILCSEGGEVLAQAYRDYPISYPRPAWADQDPGRWETALVEAINEVVRLAGVSPGLIRAVGIDGQVDGVVAVDRSGRPLRPAIIWLDRRAVQQCAKIAAAVEKESLFRLTGVNLDASHVAPKILWIRDNEPDIYRQAWKFLLPTSYAVLRMTGETPVDYSNASSTMLFDVHQKQWAPGLFEAFGISPETMSEVFPATSVAGGLTTEMAALTGLKPGTPVTVGCGDEHAACIGAGVIEPGLICDIGGTAEPVCTTSREPVFDPSGLVETHCHGDPQTWLIENPGFVSGANYRWFREEFGGIEVEAARLAGIEPYDLLNRQAAAVPPGCEGVIFLPCMMGAMTPEWNDHARGVFYGLTLGHGRGHLIRAILEATAFGLRDIVERMEAIGLPAREIRAIGGAARSSLWLQIKADVLEKKVVVPETVETSSLGAAMLAGVSCGVFSDLPEAVNRLVKIKKVVEPDPANRELYARSYSLYRRVFDSLKSVFEEYST